MLLQTATRELELGLLLLTLALVGLVSYWVYRDAEARGMPDAAYWGAAVGVAFVVGLIVGGVVAVGVYLSTRPEAYEGAQEPFSRADPDEPRADSSQPDQDPAHADLPPAPTLTESRVERASDTAIRGYARRYDDLDATADPDRLRAALRDLVERGAAEKLVTTTATGESDEPAAGSSEDTRRHVGRPAIHAEETATEDGATADGGESAESGDPGTDDFSTDDPGTGDERAEFEWVTS